MKTFVEFLQSNPVVDVVGWALIHFLWQATAVALLIHLLSSTIRASNSHAKYRLFAFGMLLMLACPIVTFFYLKTLPGNSHSATAAFERVVEEGVFPVGILPVTSSEIPAIKVGNSKVGNSKPVASETESEESKFEPVAAKLSVVPGLIRGSLPFFVLSWLCGVVLHFFRLGAGLTRVIRWKSNAIEIKDGELRSVFDGLVSRMKLRTVQLLQTDDLTVSAVVGFWKPVVLVPVSMVVGLSANSNRVSRGSKLFGATTIKMKNEESDKEVNRSDK